MILTRISTSILQQLLAGYSYDTTVVLTRIPEVNYSDYYQDTCILSNYYQDITTILTRIPLVYYSDYYQDTTIILL